MEEFWKNINSKVKFLPQTLYHLTSAKDITTVNILLYFLPYDFNSYASMCYLLKMHIAGLLDFYNLKILLRYVFM